MNEQTINSAITIRRLDVSDADRAAVARLAGRDSASLPEAPVIGVEIEGRLVAARSLASGEVVADPFSRTEELRAMLELRAKHLQRREQAQPAGLRAARRGARVARLVGL